VPTEQTELNSASEDAVVEDPGAAETGGRTLGRTAAWLGKQVEIGLGTADLSLPQYRVLGLLDERSAVSSDLAERLAVRPGLTGLAQVRGWRGDTCIRQRVASDLEYLESRGLASYAQILIKTIGVEWRRTIRNAC